MTVTDKATAELFTWAAKIIGNKGVKAKSYYNMFEVRNGYLYATDGYRGVKAPIPAATEFADGLYTLHKATKDLVAFDFSPDDVQDYPDLDRLLSQMDDPSITLCGDTYNLTSVQSVLALVTVATAVQGIDSKKLYPGDTKYNEHLGTFPGFNQLTKVTTKSIGDPVMFHFYGGAQILIMPMSLKTRS